MPLESYQAKVDNNQVITNRLSTMLHTVFDEGVDWVIVSSLHHEYLLLVCLQPVGEVE